MERLCHVALACVAFFFEVSFAGHVHHEQSHLRTAVATSEESVPIKTAIEASISSFALASPWSAAAQKSTGAGDKNDKKQGPPVQVQVDQSLVKQFTESLSWGCSERFADILHGKGPQLHTFGSSGVKADEAGCTKLRGTVCATEAKITQTKTSVTNGRSFDQVVEVTGDSCLPTECMQQPKDLQAITHFMHAQAKSTVPGDAHDVQLQVDCSKSGAGKAAVGVPTPEAEVQKPAKSGSRSSTLIVVVACMAAAWSWF
jgi:hypothetical protein